MSQQFHHEQYSDVIRIAREAGHVILEIYALFNEQTETLDDILIAKKADASPLTKADLAAHQIITARLKNLTSDIPVVSEEDSKSWDARHSHHTFWLVDPLDGTKEFLAHNGEFTVNIALIQNHIVVFGVIFAPVLNEMYWGGKKMGAFREHNGQIQTIHVSKQKASNAHLRVIASRSHLNPETKKLISKFEPYTLVRAGSSLKFCRIAEGAADVYPRLGPTCEWDTAAGQAIVEGAGGQVLQLDGSILRYGKLEILNPAFIAVSEF